MLPLCHLFNLSFKLGYIPDCLKIAMVKPIYKKGPQDNFTNYRPISLLSSFSKLLEKIASNQMMKYIGAVLFKQTSHWSKNQFSLQ